MHELQATRTAQWYQAARSATRAGAWNERMRCFSALRAILAERQAEQEAQRRPGERRSQPPIRLSGVLTQVASRAHFAGAEPVYRRWRARPDDQATRRWAGPDPGVKPGAAFIAEAKIVSFWPYRECVLKSADAFDLTRTEVAAAYLEAIAAWAGDEAPLAACYPAGPPGCVTEDMAVLAADHARRDDATSEAIRTMRLAELADDVVGCVLADPGISPTDAYDQVREEALLLLAEPAGSIADRVTSAVAELADRILLGGDGEPVLGTDKADQVLTALHSLASLLARQRGKAVRAS
jgi:hypothetical protein